MSNIPNQSKILFGKDIILGHFGGLQAPNYEALGCPKLNIWRINISMFLDVSSPKSTNTRILAGGSICIYIYI